MLFIIYIHNYMLSFRCEAVTIVYSFPCPVCTFVRPCVGFVCQALLKQYNYLLLADLYISRHNAVNYCQYNDRTLLTIVLPVMASSRLTLYV